MDNLKPVEKGYQINFSRVEDVDQYTKHHIDDTFSAVNEKEARREALRILHENGVENDYLGDPLTYISVQVKRFPELDRFMISGKLRTRHEISYDKEKEDRDNGFLKLLEENPDAWAFIRKGGYYYQPNVFQSAFSCLTGKESFESLLRANKIYQVNPFAGMFTPRLADRSISGDLGSVLGDLIYNDLRDEWKQAEEFVGNWICLIKVKEE